MVLPQGGAVVDDQEGRREAACGGDKLIRERILPLF